MKHDPQFTVILKYPDYMSDGDEYYSSYASALNPQDAVERVRWDAAKAVDPIFPDFDSSKDFAVVAVFKGRHMFLMAE